MASSSESDLAHPVTLRARLRLLQSLTSRGSSEIAALLIPPVLLWTSTRNSPGAVLPLLCWWGLMACMAGALMLFRFRLQRQWLQAGSWPPQQLREALQRWEWQLALAALINGLMWALVLAFTWSGSHSDLRLLVYLVLIGVMASATTFLAPVPVVFCAFLTGIYLPVLLSALHYFPSKGPYLLPLLLLYGLIIGRHAWGARHFVVQQMEHELERHTLAERYREAKVVAEQALEEKNWFVSAASHDLRQPLHAMGLMLEAMRQRNQDREVAQLLQEVQACTRDLGAMFNDLMDLSRLEGGSFAPQWQRVPLGAVLHEGGRLFAQEARQRGLHLRIVLPARPVVLYTDAVLLRQMVFNLLQNAVRYTEKGGVLLGLRRRQGRLLLQVWDSGNGMAAEELSRVFKRHYRRPQSHQQEDGSGVPLQLRGRGLGLSVVALAAQRLGVSYGVHSRQGKGSCFWLWWPALDEYQATLSSTPSVEPQAGHPSLVNTYALAHLQGRCLMVENDAQVGPALKKILQAWGVEVQEARSCDEALQMLAQGWVPDFVLCDQQLQAGESGLDCLALLLEQCPEASGALMSGDAVLLEQAQDHGYLALAKPLQPEQLHAVLARCMDYAPL